MSWKDTFRKVTGRDPLPDNFVHSVHSVHAPECSKKTGKEYNSDIFHNPFNIFYAREDIVGPLSHMDNMDKMDKNPTGSNNTPGGSEISQIEAGADISPDHKTPIQLNLPMNGLKEPEPPSIPEWARGYDSENRVPRNTRPLEDKPKELNSKTGLGDSGPLGLPPEVFEEIKRIVPSDLDRAMDWIHKIFPGARMTGTDQTPESETEKLDCCHWCGGREFWKAQGGPLTCRACHPPVTIDLVSETRGSASRRTFWPPETARMIDWFRTVELPAEEFVFRTTGPGRVSHITIQDPEKWRRSLLQDVERGPSGPRNLYGAVEDDLNRAWELFGGGGLSE